MLNIVSIIIYSFILVSSSIFIWHKLISRKINIKNYKIYITLIGLMSVSLINYFLISSFIKITIITVIFMLFFWFLFKENIKKCIITPIFYQLIIMVSEGILILSLIFILNLNLNELKEEFLGTFFINVGTAVISILLVSIPYTLKLYNFIIININKLNNHFLIILSILTISVANILAAITYYQVNIILIVIVNISFSLFCSFVVFYSFRTQNRYNNVNDKYNIAINSLNDYEDMMSKYRINNHENKNLLLAIRAMILNNEKDIPNYIDSIIKNKYNDSEKLLLKVNVIPSGGLRATIYSEILKIKEKNINYQLNIDKRIKTIDLIDIDTNTIIDICKILGVFIDNAIEEVIKTKRKNLIINIYTFEDNLNIDVANNYEKQIEINKIYNEGYTTKGNNHGYGLSLVKKIINNNPIFENKMNISKDFFTQTLIIKYKRLRNK